MKTLFTVTVLFCSLNSWAHDLDHAQYLKMQDALTKDDFKGALSHHQTICEKELTHYKENYLDCGKKFKSIDELRESFKSLSKLFIENGKKEEMKDLIVAECPMAKAKWIQPKGKIRNPYYGASMLTCGQKI